jgi:hypothetical protein
MTEFRQLNHGWNADPNAPAPRVTVDGADITLSFLMNALQFPEFREGDRGTLCFFGCAQYRLGGTNDEGWYLGKCRFSKLAPAWGEFYEVLGDSRLAESPQGWIQLARPSDRHRHFLFYLRDDTFECDALAWTLCVNGRYAGGERI